MHVRMYFSVCRWCKQLSTGNPGRGAVLLTVWTANELCSFLPWTGAVSCVSWTCNRGTTEGEQERFLLFSLIPNPSWEWSHSQPILVWELGASYKVICFALQTVTKVYTVIGNLTKYVSSFPPCGSTNIWYLVSQQQHSSFMCVHIYKSLFFPLCDIFSLNCKCGLLGSRFSAQSAPSCMYVASDWSFSPFCSTSASLANCRTSSKPSREWWGSVTERCFQSHRLIIYHL